MMNSFRGETLVLICSLVVSPLQAQDSKSRLEWFHIQGSDTASGTTWPGWTRLIDAGLNKAREEGKALLMLGGDFD